MERKGIPIRGNKLFFRNLEKNFKNINFSVLKIFLKFWPVHLGLRFFTCDRTINDYGMGGDSS